MKKSYLKPNAEYISFMTMEAIANKIDDDDIVIKPGVSDGEDDWV